MQHNQSTDASDTGTQVKPYADGHRAYVDAGWVNVLPVDGKGATPEGYTGYGERNGGQAYANKSDYARWAEHRGGDNLTLVMPTGVIGLDVDAYKDTAAARQFLDDRPDLPPTYVSSSRFGDGYDGMSGIRLYQLPDRHEALAKDRVWVSYIGPVDLIRYGHRQVVSWPSVHPKRGTQYRWVDERTGEIMPEGFVPSPYYLPVLPEHLADEWLKPEPSAKAKGKKSKQQKGQQPVGFEPPEEWLTDGDPCQAVQKRLDKALDHLQGKHRHDDITKDTLRLLRLGEQGHQGARKAIEDLAQAWLDTMTAERGWEAGPEFIRMIDGAAGRIFLDGLTAPEDMGCCGPGRGKPLIDVTNIPSGYRQVLDFIQGRGDIFVRGGELHRVVRLNGRDSILPMVQPPEVQVWTEARAHVFRMVGTGANRRPEESFVPEALAKALISRQEWDGVAQIERVAQMPYIRPDGTVATGRGYVDGIWFDIPTDLEAVVPAGGMAVLRDALKGFPYVDDADEANHIAMLLTPQVKAICPSLFTPLFACSAATQSTGKTLASGDIPGAIAGGCYMMRFQGDEPELRKLITATLRTDSSPHLLFDNVAPGLVVDSASLAQLLTSRFWSDRVLGVSRNVTLPWDRMMAVNGNNLQIGPDLVPRTVLIRLDADTPRPAERVFAERLDDPAVLEAKRPELVAAALLCVQEWVLAGSPLANGLAPMRQFTTWSQMLGGLLEFHGVKGFLDNRDALESINPDIDGMALLLKALRDEFGTGGFTAKQAADAIDKDDSLDEALPTWIADKVDRDYYGPPHHLTHKSKAALTRSLGNTFKNRKGQYYGDLRIDPRSGATRTGAVRWKIEEAE